VSAAISALSHRLARYCGRKVTWQFVTGPHARSTFN